nr:fosfomycin resistance glutathione transferase [uncultured Dongia sp.]
MITGINHLTLAVRKLEQSFDFYANVLGFRPIARWPKGAYFLAGDLWVAITVDAHPRSGPPADYTHIAFSVAAADFEAMHQRIIAAGCPIWQENASEGDSVYFLDPNGHKLEIHASDLAARMKAAREKPWEGFEILDDSV